MCFMKSDNNQEKKTFPINPVFSIEMVCLTVEPQNPQTNSYAKQFESCVYAFVVHSSLFTFCFLNHMTLFWGSEKVQVCWKLWHLTSCVEKKGCWFDVLVECFVSSVFPRICWCSTVVLSVSISGSVFAPVCLVSVSFLNKEIAERCFDKNIKRGTKISFVLRERMWHVPYWLHCGNLNVQVIDVPSKWGLLAALVWCLWSTGFHDRLDLFLCS